METPTFLFFQRYDVICSEQALLVCLQIFGIYCLNLHTIRDTECCGMTWHPHLCSRTPNTKLKLPKSCTGRAPRYSLYKTNEESRIRWCSVVEKFMLESIWQENTFIFRHCNPSVYILKWLCSKIYNFSRQAITLMLIMESEATKGFFCFNIWCDYQWKYQEKN